MDERLKNIEPKMVELITNEIMDHGPTIGWNDIAGLEFAKKTVRLRGYTVRVCVCVLGNIQCVSGDRGYTVQK